MIDDVDYRQAMVDHNYQVGLEHFSYRVLRKTLAELLRKAI